MMKLNMPLPFVYDPAHAATFAHLDATIVMNRALTEISIYPAVDVLDSNSTSLDPEVVGEEHYRVAREVQRVLQCTTIFDSHNITITMLPFDISSEGFIRTGPGFQSS